MNYHYYNDDELWLLNYINKIKFEQLYFIENKNQQKLKKKSIKKLKVFLFFALKFASQIQSFIGTFIGINGGCYESWKVSVNGHLWNQCCNLTSYKMLSLGKKVKKFLSFGWFCFFRAVISTTVKN